MAIATVFPLSAGAAPAIAPATPAAALLVIAFLGLSGGSRLRYFIGADSLFAVCFVADLFVVLAGGFHLVIALRVGWLQRIAWLRLAIAAAP